VPSRGRSCVFRTTGRGYKYRLPQTNNALGFASPIRRPAIAKSGAGWDEPPGLVSLAVAKADIAGFICRREMTDHPNDQTVIQMDIATCRGGFDRSIGAGDAAFAALLQAAEQRILPDLKSRQVREEIRAEARRFEAVFFPPP
jgi:hypothetical protein